MKNLSLILLFCLSCALGQGRALIEGEAEYNFSDNETLIEAKSLCYNMALRNAVESYQIFVSSMSDVRNMQLRNDIIQTLSTGYLEDLTVVDERIDKNNNIIYYKLRAYIQPEPFKKALKQEVKRRSKFAKPASITKGRFLEIIQIIERRDYPNDIKVVYKKIGNQWEWINPLMKDNPYADKQEYSRDFIYITFFDDDGIPIDGSKNTLEALLPNEIRTTSFKKSRGTKTFELRLTK